MKGSDQPLSTPDARTLIRQVLETGTVTWSSHALREMENDDLQTPDCTNVLRGGVVHPPDVERGTWRYRVSTGKICVVVAFRSETEIVVVTAWRSAQ